MGDSGVTLMLDYTAVCRDIGLQIPLPVADPFLEKVNISDLGGHGNFQLELYQSRGNSTTGKPTHVVALISSKPTSVAAWSSVLLSC
uniref:Uncharacterized protein n=1 Tax=Timema genevievae TaxID=629358 RepID=A0A7R9JWW8_TIMGE|nr:unnamed protein product [Timema genevievae]